MKGRDWVNADNGVSYFPCVCGECVETMQDYYRHMDYCMTEKRQNYLSAIKTAIREGSRSDRIEELLAGEESWNTTASPWHELYAKLRVLQDRAMDEQTIIVLASQVPQAGFEPAPHAV